jgi:hypothetical protein
MNETEITRRREEAGARLSEDESLTGDLSDDEAAPLLAWARSCAEAGAQQAALSAEAFDAFLSALHKAARRGARTSSPVESARAALLSLGWIESGQAAHEPATVPASALSLLSSLEAAPREPVSDE